MATHWFEVHCLQAFRASEGIADTVRGKTKKGRPNLAPVPLPYLNVAKFRREFVLTAQ